MTPVAPGGKFAVAVHADVSGRSASATASTRVRTRVFFIVTSSS
jgi:hypothetical protein